MSTPLERKLPAEMQASTSVLAYIRSFEALRLKAYRDQGGVWTIGYGHTANVHPGDEVSPADAERLFELDVANARGALVALVKVDLTQDEFDALLDFVFNLGSGALARSTLLRVLNAGNRLAAAAEFPGWRFVNKVESPGLLKRRMWEKRRFLGQI